MSPMRSRRRERQTSGGLTVRAISVVAAAWLAMVASPGLAQDETPFAVGLADGWQIEAMSSPPSRHAAPGKIEGADPIRRSSASPAPAKPVALPASWQLLVDVAGSSDFRLSRRIEIDNREPLASASQHPALWLPPGGLSSCRLLRDGKPVADLGSRHSPLPFDRGWILNLDTEAARPWSFVLSFECSMPSYLPAYLRQRTVLGDEPPRVGDLGVLVQMEQVRRLERSRRHLPWLLLPTFLLAVGAYHLRLFGLRQRSMEYLWFGFLAVDLATVVFFHRWAPELLLAPAISSRVLEAGGHGLLVLLVIFLEKFLAQPRSRLLSFYLQTHLFWILWVLLVPGYVWVLRTDALRRLWGLPGWIYLAVFLLAAVRHRQGEERLVCLGGLAVVISGLFAWLMHFFAGGAGYGLLPWSFVLFTLAMAYALARRFNRAHGEIDRLRRQLEEMVEDRTTELSVANDRLKAEIAEQQLAEEAMQMLERAVEQSIDGILVVDLERRVQFANQAWAQMHGREVFEVLGRDLSAFHTDQQMEEEIEPFLAKVFETGSGEGEVGHRRQDGTVFPAWTSFSLLRDVEGEPVGCIAVGRDVSADRRSEVEHQQLERKVQQSRKLESLGKLASGLAHDYNNLLTGVLGNVSLLRRNLQPGPLLDRLQQVEAAAERAVDLTSQLRSYAGEDALLLAPVDVSALIRRMEGELQRLVGGSAALDLRLEANLPSAQLDTAQIRHLVRNLVSNAAEAIDRQDGRILIRTSVVHADRDLFLSSVFDTGQAAGAYFRLAIEDNGKGIEPAIQSKMFDPFFTTRASARGLGLAIVLGIVRAHGGAIQVRSQPGRGSVLSVLLPLSADAATGTEATKSEPTWVGSGRILVVDDEELMREVSSSILEAQGFEVLTAATGRRAIQLFEQERSSILLVLLDRTMPGMSGEEVLARMRQIDASVTAVLMSGYKEKDAMEGFDPSHLSGFLAKPFRPVDLLRHVRRAVGREGGGT